MIDVVMPKMGESITVGTILEWKKQVSGTNKDFAIMYVPREGEWKKDDLGQDSWKYWLKNLCKNNGIDFIDPKNSFIKFEKFNKPIGTGDVINSNFCKISVCENRNSNEIIVISAIDNLIKGGSGQAVQNMNLAFGYKESLGLI